MFASLKSLLREAILVPIWASLTPVRYRHVRFHGAARIGPGCTFGRDVSVYRGCVISAASIGDYSYIGGNSEVKNARLGKYCSIAPEVKIGLGMHPADLVSTYPGFYSEKASGAVRIGAEESISESARVNVGHDVWIGTRAMIVDGVSIGNGAIVAAGAIVTKDVPPFAIVAGVPAQIIRMRFSRDVIEFFQTFAWWDRGLSFCKQHQALFLSPDEFVKRFCSEFNAGDGFAGDHRSD